jgi:hypothetical protein
LTGSTAWKEETCGQLPSIDLRVGSVTFCVPQVFIPVGRTLAKIPLVGCVAFQVHARGQVAQRPLCLMEWYVVASCGQTSKCVLGAIR